MILTMSDVNGKQSFEIFITECVCKGELFYSFTILIKNNVLPVSQRCILFDRCK